VPYPRKLLNPGEQIAFDLHPHWWYFAPLGTLAVAIVAAAVVVTVTLKDATQTYTLLGVAVFAAVWLVAFLVKLAEWRTTQFVLTSDRLIVRSGVLSKQGREIPLERINDLSYHQSFFERLVGAGDLVIESAGERGQDMFSRIPHPAHAQQLIYTEMESNRQRVSGVHIEQQASSIPDSLAAARQATASTATRARRRTTSARPTPIRNVPGEPMRMRSKPCDVAWSQMTSARCPISTSVATTRPWAANRSTATFSAILAKAASRSSGSISKWLTIPRSRLGG